VLEAVSDSQVREVDVQKSSQIGWTDGVLINWLGQIVDEQPAPTIVLFPSDKKIREFNAEKWEPAVEATPALAAKLVTKSRAKENRQDFKEFAGGYIKYVGSNSPANLKQSTAGNLAVEEPDDCNLNIKGQGDSITMLEERGKRYGLAFKLLVGGTPSIAGVSSIAARMEQTDKRIGLVACHHCGQETQMKWENVRWSNNPERRHPILGDALPESARYVCPHCGGEWTEAERVANIERHHRWQPTAEFRGKRGFYFNELMSTLPGCELAAHVEKYLIAKHALESEGDVSKMIVFWNQTLGLPWEYKGTVADVKDLEARLEDYPEWFVPWGGLVLTVGIDVQHDRLVIVVLAWGEGEECWLVWFGELHGNVLEEAVWDELERTAIFRRYKHVSGAEMAISAVSVDAGDGQTADAVYKWARRANRKFGADRVMPIRGSTVESSEIFRAPAKPLDVTATHKAAKYGLRPYIVGVSRAKDLILGADENAGRINLRDASGATGHGPGRMHWYRGVRGDYLDQLTAEVKAPARDGRRGGRLVKRWLVKAGKENHGLDATIYGLHAARALRIDTYSTARWAQLREQIFQGHLFARAEQDAALAQGTPAPSPWLSTAPSQEGEAGGPEQETAPAEGVQMSAQTDVPAGMRTDPGPKAAVRRPARRVRSAGVRL
jgi:phage terminase large subunit GpA-like protein